MEGAGYRQDHLGGGMTLQQVLERAKEQGATHFRTVEHHPRNDGRPSITLLRPATQRNATNYVIAESLATQEEDYADFGAWSKIALVPAGAVDNPLCHWQKIP